LFLLNGIFLVISDMSENSASTFHIEKLNNKNYAAWSYKMQMYLMKEKCWKVVESVAELKDSDVAADEKAWNYIGLFVDDSQLIYVRDAKSGRAAWKKLKEFHVQSTLSARIRILKGLFRMKLDHGDDMEVHLQRIFEQFAELNAIGHGLDNEMSVSVMLASLNQDYEPLITALEAWDSAKLTIEAVGAKLVEEHSRKTAKVGESSGVAMKSVQRQRGYDQIVCYGCNKRGHLHRDCRINPLRGSNRDEYSAGRSDVSHDPVNQRRENTTQAKVAR
jgi:gag-polypeptide of LTR copia-type